MNKKYVLGVDVGGSHITVGLINLAEKTFLEGSEIRRHVNPHASADEIIGIWTGIVKDTLTAYPDSFSKIGFAMPGPFDYENGVALIKGFDKYDNLYGLNIREILAEKLGIKGCNILFRNDAEAFLEGEKFCGAAKGFNHAIGITLGTGLGSAKSNNGITEDAELSVTPYKDGIAEDYISTRGILKTYFEVSGVKAQNVKSLSEKYNDDEKVRETFYFFSKNLAWFLDMFIKNERPDILVIGGNIANAWDYFMDDVKVILHPYLSNVKIVKAELGETAALIGGACSFINQNKIQTV